MNTERIVLFGWQNAEVGQLFKKDSSRNIK